MVFMKGGILMVLSVVQTMDTALSMGMPIGWRSRAHKKTIARSPASDTSNATVLRGAANASSMAHTPDGQVILDLGDGGDPIAVTLSSGRVVIQKRTSGSIDFFRGWSEYKSGFGDNDNFWLGNDNIHRLTAASSEIELRVDLVDADGLAQHVTYSTFHVDSETNLYRLTIGGFSGDIGDSLAIHNGRSFSTSDQDNDLYQQGSCASKYLGAWWYNDCHKSNLNGRYEGPGSVSEYATGIIWETWRGYYPRRIIPCSPQRCP
ncbi:unnamed protein product [Prorocentrum cordatum]|uniref:Fibrinogen C-terminal domain-containing protein n=1 Tax=Prorocentrum cordatum TaxID=2364126 RepID=A0ABN9TVF3_9DINO|nr:unnamed protein product [Polarella glacialis]